MSCTTTARFILRVGWSTRCESKKLTAFGFELVIMLLKSILTSKHAECPSLVFIRLPEHFVKSKQRSKMIIDIRRLSVTWSYSASNTINKVVALSRRSLHAKLCSSIGVLQCVRLKSGLTTILNWRNSTRPKRAMSGWVRQPAQRRYGRQLKPAYSSSTHALYR